MDLQLTQSEANQLIVELKELTKTVKGIVEDGDRGIIPVQSVKDERKFKIAYFYEYSNIHINFYDVKTGLSLVRLNLNDSFHRNADGTKVTGNRVNIFSAREYELKNDQKTHMRAYPLPHGILKNTSNFLEALTNLLEYTHTRYKGKLDLALATELNM